jgi:hypothetical protein
VFRFRFTDIELGDNMSVVLNNSFPSRALTKKHISIAFHLLVKAIAAKIMRFVKIKDKEMPVTS